MCLWQCFQKRFLLESINWIKKICLHQSGHGIIQSIESPNKTKRQREGKVSRSLIELRQPSCALGHQSSCSSVLECQDLHQWSPSAPFLAFCFRLGVTLLATLVLSPLDQTKLYYHLSLFASLRRESHGISQPPWLHEPIPMINILFIYLSVVYVSI